MKTTKPTIQTKEQIAEVKRHNKWLVKCLNSLRRELIKVTKGKEPKFNYGHIAFLNDTYVILTGKKNK